MSKLCECKEKKVADIFDDIYANGWCRNDIDALVRDLGGEVFV